MSLLPYVEINPSNIAEVGAILDSSGGDILGAEVQLDRVTMGLWRNVRIRGNYFTAEVDLKRNRRYTLRSPSEYSYGSVEGRVADWFEGLKINKDWIFEIGGQFAVGFGLLPSKRDSKIGDARTIGRMFYVPREEALDVAIHSQLDWSVEKVQEELKRLNWSRELIGLWDMSRIVNYVMEDLKTGRVVKHNIQAGVDADVALGIG